MLAGRACSPSCKSQAPLCPGLQWSRWCLCIPAKAQEPSCFCLLQKQFLMKVEMRYFYIKIPLQKYEKWVMTTNKIQKNLGYSQQTGPHWPSPGKHRLARRCWSTSWIRWWCNSLYVSLHVSLKKRHHSLTLLQRGRNFPPVSHDKQGSAGKLHQQECGDPLLVVGGVCGLSNLTYFNHRDHCLWMTVCSQLQ